MLQKFKITSYAIIVALAAVLVLPVNAAELQLVSPTGIQVAQIIDKVPAERLKRLKKERFLSLDKEAIGAINEGGARAPRTDRTRGHDRVYARVGEVF